MVNDRQMIETLVALREQLGLPQFIRSTRYAMPDGGLGWLDLETGQIIYAEPGVDPNVTGWPPEGPSTSTYYFDRAQAAGEPVGLPSAPNADVPYPIRCPDGVIYWSAGTVAYPKDHPYSRALKRLQAIRELASQPAR